MPFWAAPATPGSNSSGGRFSPSWSCRMSPPLRLEASGGATVSDAGSAAAPSAAPPSAGAELASSPFFGGVVLHNRARSGRRAAQSDTGRRRVATRASMDWKAWPSFSPRHAAHHEGLAVRGSPSGGASATLSGSSPSTSLSGGACRRPWRKTWRSSVHCVTPRRATRRQRQAKCPRSISRSMTRSSRSRCGTQQHLLASSR